MSLAYTAPGYKLVHGVPAGQGDCHLVGDRRVHPQLTVIQESTGGCREKADPGAIQGTDTDWEADSLKGQEGRGVKRTHPGAAGLAARSDAHRPRAQNQLILLSTWPLGSTG